MSDVKYHLQRYSDFMQEARKLHAQFALSEPRASAELSQLHAKIDLALDAHTDAIQELTRMRAAIDKSLNDGT